MSGEPLPGRAGRPVSPHTPHAPPTHPPQAQPRSSHMRTHVVLLIWIKPTEPLRSLCFSAAWFICYSCRSASSPLLLCLPPPSLSLAPAPSPPALLLAAPACGSHSALVQYLPRFMESWMSCHLQLPWIYSPDERMWEEECFTRAVKTHSRFITNNTARGGYLIFRLKKN